MWGYSAYLKARWLSIEKLVKLSEEFDSPAREDGNVYNIVLALYPGK